MRDRHWKRHAMRLQWFAQQNAADTPDTGGGGADGAACVDGAAGGEPTYTQKQLDDAISAARRDALEQAKNGDGADSPHAVELLRQENAAKDEEIRQLRQQALHNQLSGWAAHILKDNHGIAATQNMLDFVVADGAEETNARIEKLVGILEDDRRNIAAARAAGRTPRVYAHDGSSASEIDRRIAKYQ